MHRPDYFYIILVAILLVLGLLILSSVGTAVGYQKFKDSYYYFKRQLWHSILGLVFLFFLSQIGYQKLRRWIGPALIISLLLLVAVFIPGLGTSYGRGTESWINIFGFSLQPAEIIKLVYILYLAHWLSNKKKKELSQFTYGLLPFCLILGLIGFLILLQPDLGTLIIIILTAFSVYFLAGARLRYIFLIGLLGSLIVTILILITPYRLNRILVFLNPSLEPRGAAYQINQAFLAIGSGGFWGRGFGQSRQKFQYLPEATGDSIFAIAAEELGFVGAVILVGLFLLLTLRGFWIGSQSKNTFGRLVAFGITSWFGWQALINIGAMVGVLPLTGIPLPFVSYGGTAMVVSLSAVGIMINISIRQSLVRKS